MLRRGLAAVLVALLVTTGSAMWRFRGEQVPVDRLVATLTRRVEEHPDDAHAHYVLARVHSLAFARGDETVYVSVPEKGTDELPEFAPGTTVRVEGPTADLTEERRNHCLASIRHYRRAVALDDTAALTHLGLAWMIDAGRVYVKSFKTPTGEAPERKLTAEAAQHIRALVDEMTAEGDVARRAERELVTALPGCLAEVLTVTEARALDDAHKAAAWKIVSRYWEDEALRDYRRAYALRRDADLELDSVAMEGDSAIAEEAAEAIVRILGAREQTDEVKAELKGLEEFRSAMSEKSRWITPVVFPVSGDRPLAALLSGGRTATFDLDGDDVPGRWPWVGDDAAFLVWAPGGAPDVTSGRALFGSVTWWMPWQNGYEPLAALDDDGDGVLCGDELVGIAVWRDRNGDARADEGEVTPAGEFGIVSIAVAPDHEQDGVPAARIGVTLQNGTTRPTYDWTPERLPVPGP